MQYTNLYINRYINSVLNNRQLNALVNYVPSQVVLESLTCNDDSG